MLQLHEFNLQIEYRNRADSVIPNSLLRAPVDKKSHSESEFLGICNVLNIKDIVSVQHLEKEQRKDSYLGCIIKFLQDEGISVTKKSGICQEIVRLKNDVLVYVKN